MKAFLRRLAPRKVRRALVVLYFLLFINGLAVLFFGVGGASKEVETLGLLAVLGAVILGGVFYGVSSPADFRPAAQLDERQHSVRLEAMADSYRIVCILLALVHLVYALQSIYGYSLGPRTGLGSSSSLLFLPFVLLMLSLPQALVAWREPDLSEAPDRVLPS